MRTALFGQLAEDDEAVGDMVETAIFSQWFHSNVLLHYARWKSGEVDIVILDKRQKPAWVVESKWTDRFFDRPEDLKSLISFCHTHNLRQALVTTKSKQGVKTVKNVDIAFVPASLYCFQIGLNIISNRAFEAGFNHALRQQKRDT